MRDVSYTETISFLQADGTNSDMGDTSGSVPADISGVCNVCHNNVAQDHVHYTYTSSDGHNGGADCTICHLHTAAFKGSCKICHGEPPIEDVANSSSTNGENGLVDNPGTTGSVTAGMHDRHVNTEGFGCDDCHNNNIGENKHNSGLVITMGFSSFSGARQGGSYDGQIAGTVPNGYNTTSTSPATTVSAGGGKTCGSIYCHSDVQNQSDGSDSGMTYGSPEWDNAGSVQCGSCHNADGDQGDLSLMDSGTHTTHVNTGTYNMPCANCHTGAGSGSAVHVNNTVNLSIAATYGGSYDGDGAGDHTSGAGYGDCSSVYCHSDAQSSPTYQNPTWGTTLPTDCTGCHNNDVPSGTPMDSGSHTAHINDTDSEVGRNLECATCHEATVSSNRTIGTYANHVNKVKNIDINIGTETGCTNIACHSDGNFDGTVQYNNPSWGVTTYSGCDDCHGDGAGQQYPSYADGGAGTGASNSHNVHVGTHSFTCGECHEETSTAGASIDGTDSTKHVNQTVNVVLGTGSYNGGGETCSSTLCHGGTSDAWGTDNSGIDTCTKCHGTKTAGSATDAQKAITLPLNLTDELNSTSNCSECHKVPSAVTDADHLDASPAEVFTLNTANIQKADLNSVTPNYSGGTCTVYCHGAALPKGSPSGTTPDWNTNLIVGSTPSLSNYCDRCHQAPPTGLAPHDASHDTLAECADCHPHFNNDGTLDAGANRAKHINGSVEIADNCNACHSSAGGPTPGTTPDATHDKHIDTAYVGTVTGGDYGNTGSTWYDYSNTGGTPDAGCGYCHPQSDANHMDGNIDLNFDPADTGAAGTLKARNASVESYSQTGGTSVTCSSVYCHSDGNDDATPGVYGYQTSPDWYGGTFGADRCDDCHGNSPATNSHGKHVVGIHYDDIYSGSSGLATEGTGNTNSHGNSSYSTTINCNNCHNATVTTSANDQNTVCDDCHGSTAGLQGDMVIAAASAVHVNGTVNLSFASINVKSKAQLRDDITEVTELDNSWDRTVSGVGYKEAGTRRPVHLTRARTR
jgi:predicted CxxxxCH...CXXCH cytochrome family protein